MQPKDREVLSVQCSNLSGASNVEIQTEHLTKRKYRLASSKKHPPLE